MDGTPTAIALEEIVASAPHPLTEAWRAVAADQLAEADPDLGTFIQLQLRSAERPLNREERTLMRTLFARHGDTWLQPIRDGLVAGHLRFERGFLDVANVYPQGRQHAEALAKSPLWATVTQLSATRHLPRLLKRGDFRNLETLGTAFLTRPDGARTCPAWGMPLRCDYLYGIRVPPTLRALQVDLGTETRVQAFTNCFGRGSLAALVEIGITCANPVSKRVLDQLPETLTRVSLDVPQREIDTWLALVTRRFPGLEVVDVVLNAELVTLKAEDGFRGLEMHGPIPPCWP
jgi:hypothetical protein